MRASELDNNNKLADKFIAIIKTPNLNFDTRFIIEIIYFIDDPNIIISLKYNISGAGGINFTPKNNNNINNSIKIENENIYRKRYWKFAESNNEISLVEKINKINLVEKKINILIYNFKLKTLANCKIKKRITERL